MPSCVIDHCTDVECGGESKCINGIGNYTCECVDGWSGGGVNATCEKGCECTGNKGYWKADNRVVEGEVIVGYNYGAGYGNKCEAHDVSRHPATDGKPVEAWVKEPWYVDSSRRKTQHAMD